MKTLEDEGRELYGAYTKKCDLVKEIGGKYEELLQVAAAKVRSAFAPVAGTGRAGSYPHERCQDAEIAELRARLDEVQRAAVGVSEGADAAGTIAALRQQLEAAECALRVAEDRAANVASTVAGAATATRVAELEVELRAARAEQVRARHARRRTPAR